MDNNMQKIKDNIRERHDFAARFKVNLMNAQIEKRKEISRIFKEAENAKKEAEEIREKAKIQADKNAGENKD